MSQSGKAAWSLVTALSLALSLASLRSADGGNIVPGCCLAQNGTCELLASAPECTQQLNGTFTPDEVCTGEGACRPSLVGCCVTLNGFCTDNELEAGCPFISSNSTFFVPDAVCDPNEGAVAATSGRELPGCATYTPTATATATATEVPGGGDCVEPDDCVSGNCVDNFCCDTECDGPLEVCNLEGQEGTCVAVTAPAPAVSSTGIVVALLGLFTVGVFALRLRRANR